MSCNEEKTLKDLNKFLNERGMNFFELIEMTGRYNSSLLMLTDEHARRFNELYDQLNCKNIPLKDKGKVLEELTSIIFYTGHSKLLECRRNCRTSTNEIDLQLNWTQHARLAGANRAFPCFGESFLCECKNYSRKVGVTYIGKFYSLLKVTQTKLGIIIAWKGITGRGAWSDSLGLIKKIALRDEIYIIPIDKTDLDKIGKRKAHIFEIVYSKYNALRCDIDYSQYVLKHENEEKFLS